MSNGFQCACASLVIFFSVNAMAGEGYTQRNALESESKPSFLHPLLQVEDMTRRSSLSATQPTAYILETTRVLSQIEVKRLSQEGIHFNRDSRGPIHSDRFYSVILEPSEIEWLQSFPLAQRLLPAWPKTVLPGNQSSIPNAYNLALQENYALAARTLRGPDGSRLTGKGQIFCQIDSGIDVFHPLFFHGDGGFYPWADQDGDGVFTLGTDGIDMNEDGVLDPSEVLQTTGGEFIDKYTGQLEKPTPPVQLNRTWLYIDTNENDKRDKGSGKGFDESTPAYGEPMFVVEDINHNHKVDIGERLIRLGTSKIRGLFDPNVDRTYLRGIDLVEVVPTQDYSHGTGVAGILLGGIPGYTALEGVAPGAEVFVVSYFDLNAHETDEGLVSTFVDGVAECKKAGATLYVHEYGSPMAEFGDGSGSHEGFLDSLSAEGLPQVTATHNYASGYNHGIVTLGPGETKDLSIAIYDVSVVGYDPAVLYLSMRWREGLIGDLLATMNLGEGAMGLNDGEEEVESFLTWSTRETSNRGTHLSYSAIGREDYSPLGIESGVLSLQNTGSEPLTLWIDLYDQQAYGPGVFLPEEVVTKIGTMAHPSTADSAISVGAHAANDFYPEIEIPKGLKYFSGQGPRIDGIQAIDVVAPEDHFSAAVHLPWSQGSPGNYVTFGGTSGALPHVAGAIALLREAFPEMGPEEVRSRVQSSAFEDDNTGTTPNDSWGYGKLDIYTLIAETTAPAYDPPKAIWQLDGSSVAGEITVLDGSWSSDPNNSLDELIYRWDLNRDGVWDESNVGIPSLSTIFEEAGNHWVVLEVEDPDGHWNQFLAKVNTQAAPEEEEEEEEEEEKEEEESDPRAEQESEGLEEISNEAQDETDDEGPGTFGSLEEESFASPSAAAGCAQSDPFPQGLAGIVLMGFLLWLRRNSSRIRA